MPYAGPMTVRWAPLAAGALYPRLPQEQAFEKWRYLVEGYTL